MTPKEYAEEYFRLSHERSAQMRGDDGLTISTFEAELQFAKETIEKLVRSAVEEEREDCALMVELEARGFHVLEDHAPTPQRARDMRSIQHSLNQVAKRIRSRSTIEPEAETMPKYS